ncbi:MAG: hypothetical protein LBU87_05365 [Lactobacillales bacterium]|jgi:hypothetical protein|nr:hypothetical protein [Lactobacillales bacterium]
MNKNKKSPLLKTALFGLAAAIAGISTSGCDNSSARATTDAVKNHEKNPTRFYNYSYQTQYPHTGHLPAPNLYFTESNAQKLSEIYKKNYLSVGLFVSAVGEMINDKSAPKPTKESIQKMGKSAVHNFKVDVDRGKKTEAELQALTDVVDIFVESSGARNFYFFVKNPENNKKEEFVLVLSGTQSLEFDILEKKYGETTKNPFWQKFKENISNNMTLDQATAAAEKEASAEIIKQFESINKSRQKTDSLFDWQLTSEYAHQMIVTKSISDILNRADNLRPVYIQGEENMAPAQQDLRKNLRQNNTPER